MSEYKKEPAIDRARKRWGLPPEQPIVVADNEKIASQIKNARIILEDYQTGIISPISKETFKRLMEKAHLIAGTEEILGFFESANFANLQRENQFHFLVVLAKVLEERGVLRDTS